MKAKNILISLVLMLVLLPASSFGYTVLHRFHNGQYGPGGLAYDEVTDTLWASDLIGQTILEIDPYSTNGDVINTLNVDYNSLPTGLTYKDGYLYNSDDWAEPDGLIHQVNPEDGSSVSTIAELGGLTFDNLGRLWGTNGDIELRALDPIDGSILDTILLTDFDPDADKVVGLAFEEDTQTLWVSVIKNRWNGGTLRNLLLNVQLDGTVLSIEVFDPDPALAKYEIGGLAYDNNNDILWVNYSLHDRPPAQDDTYIYKLSTEVTPSVYVKTITLKDIDSGIAEEVIVHQGANIRYKIKFMVYGEVGRLYKVAVLGKAVSLYLPDGITPEWKDVFDNPAVRTKKLMVGDITEPSWDRQIPSDATIGYYAKVKFKLKLKEYDADTESWNVVKIFEPNKKFMIVP